MSLRVLLRWGISRAGLYSIARGKEKLGNKKASSCLLEMVKQAQWLPNALVFAVENIYRPAGLKLTTQCDIEEESAEYGAYRFGLENLSVVFRIAKTTPTKIGQFVALWQRPTLGAKIRPFDIEDEIDYVIICANDEKDPKNCGQFIFSQKVLIQQNILSNHGRGGKLSFRLYPPWVKTTAKIAMKTQAWQLNYFLPLLKNEAVDYALVRKFFSVNVR